jgi:hypothetical protein
MIEHELFSRFYSGVNEFAVHPRVLEGRVRQREDKGRQCGTFMPLASMERE